MRPSALTLKKEKAMKHILLFGSIVVLLAFFGFAAPSRSAAVLRAQTVPANFAYVSGQNFYVNGVPFHYGGDNIYWLGLLVMGTPQSEANSEMANCQTAGVKVV